MQPLQRHSAASPSLASSARVPLAPRQQPSAKSSVGLIRSAYAVLYDVHARVTQLVDEAEAYLTGAYGATLTATPKARAQPSKDTALKQDNTASVAAESLLQRCIEMQELLQREGRNAAASQSPTNHLASALSVLAKCLPSDWKALLVVQPEEARAGGGVGVAAASAQEASAAAPTQEEAALAADGNGASGEGTSAFPTKRGASKAAGASFAVCPSDLVQLGLLLRRQWTLQRDLDLLVLALRDICAVFAVGRAAASSGDNLRASAAEDVPPPLMTVAVTLAMLQLPRTCAMLEAHEERMRAERLSVGGSPGAAYSYPCVATVLPVWLCRASYPRATWRGSEDTNVPSACRMTAAPVKAVVSALASARQITKQLFKWEAHVARYVSIVLEASPSGSSQQQQQQDDAPSGVGSLSAAGAAPPLHLSDRDLLFDVQANMSLEHGACNEVQLLWLTAAAAVVAAAAEADASRGGALDVGGGALASSGVRKRCDKVERTLRAIWSTSAVARALLPGVLLLLGCSAARRCSGPEKPTSDAQSRGLHCWMEAYSRGRQVLGSAHPVVEAAAALLPSSAVVATGERQAPASAPASRTAAHLQAFMAAPSNARNSVTARIGDEDAPLPPQQQQLMPTGTLTRLPPLPPLLISSRKPSQLAPAPSSPALSWPLTSAPTSTATARSSKSGPPLPLGRTLPLPLTVPSTAAAADGVTRPFRHPSLQPSLSRSRLPRSRSLRHCYRLQQPADAFTLRSDVEDAVLAADEKESAKQKKNAARRRREQRDQLQSPTATLLLSAISPKTAEAAATRASEVDAGGNTRRQTRRDRQFLPAPGAPASPPDAAVSPTLSQPKVELDSQQQQQDQEGSQELQQGDLSEGAPLDLGATLQGIRTVEPEAEQQHDSGGGGDGGGGASDEEADGAPLPSTTNSAATADQHRGSLCTGRLSGSSHMQLRGSRGAPHTHVVDVAGAVDENAKEEAEAEEEEEAEETLPERNARFQREVIMYYAALNERRVRAALILQRAWRSSKARQILHAYRQVLYQYVYTIQKAAALAIDGFLSCVVEQRRRQAALHARAVADARRRNQELREVSAARRLTRAARQWLQRQRERRRLRKELGIAHDTRLRLYTIAAVKVQQWWRRVVVEKAYWRRRTLEVEEQRRLQAEAERQAHAAATIQKRVRGIQARRYVAQLRETRKAEELELCRRRDAATTVLTIVLQEYVLRQGRLHREALALEVSREEAAQRIAAGWRRSVERRRLELAVERARQLRTSSTCIQRVWRRYAAGRQRRYLRQLRHTLQEERLSREAHTYEVIRLLQCFGRSAQAQLLVRRLKARQGRTFIENLFLVQAAGRGALTRAEMGRMHVAEQARQRAEAVALETQRWRAICLSQALLRAHASAALAQQRRRTMLAEKLVVRTTAAREMRADAAATVLQRAVRRHQMLQRTVAAEAEAAAALAFLSGMAHRLQQAWRAFAARRERRYRAAAAAQGARKRLEREEVWHLVWQDQFTELDMLCVLERQYIEEQQHVERVRVYSYLCNPNGATYDKCCAQTPGAFNADADLLKWATLYDE
ncbi:conserved hypothetical protein [Leishmania mexicana MHOM/GT/2001/U1103]|uniref:Uncharacterized protein n=1 Tax=Leishmania mexicana (strain MHOM/GT/2001/U1103) TaxID=929439 RepID=E9ANA0_LEIMU|nr:conserved hypothetical protein [Leishmania mexicana MHOM/GT/2001/U1103]CBZ24406.1 conserved hypothetical protein [Leishmania mexicana MHOM/GT/2001/U1103]